MISRQRCFRFKNQSSHSDVNRANGKIFSYVTLKGGSLLIDVGLQWSHWLSFFRQGQLVDFNSGKVSDRRGLAAVWLLRGGPTTEDAGAAGSVEASTAEFGYFSPARLGWSGSICGVFRKDPPIPAVPGRRGSGQGHRGRGTVATGSPPVVRAQGEGLAVTFCLTVTCSQMMWSGSLS